MATKQKQAATPVVPDFKDVDKEAATRAQAALAGGMQEPLKVPKSAKVSTDKKGTQYSRWTEQLSITTAYRTVTAKGLMDVVVIAKIRQSKDNNGSKVFGHHYLNLGANIDEGQEQMNDRSNGAIITLLTATGFMPQGGALKGTLLNKMFPSKGQPGAVSPLNGKAVIGNIVQQLGPQKDKDGKIKKDENGDPILGKRDNIESYLPAVAPEDDDESGDDEGAED